MKLPARLAALTAKQWRNGITFGIGAGGLIYETLSNGIEKPTLVIGFLGLMGTPFFVGADQKNTAKADPPIPPPPEPDPPTLMPIPPLTSTPVPTPAPEAP